VTCGQGPTLTSFFIFLIPLNAFIFATFEEYFVGALNLGYINGPIEGILGTVFAQLIAFWYGQKIYLQTLGELLPAHISEVLPSIVRETPLFAAMMSWAIVLCIISVLVKYVLL